MGWGRHRAASALCLVALAMAGCSSDPEVELFVNLRTDLRPELEVTSVRTTVAARGEGGTVEAERFRPVTVTDRLLEGERIAELSGLAPGPKRVRVELRGPRADVIATRASSLELESDRLLRVAITSSCVGVECPGGGDEPSATECLGGLCVPPECLDVGSGACGATQCETDDQCSAPSACAEARCDDGLCIGAPDDDRCAEDELCSVSDGCRASPGTGACAPCSSERDCVDTLVCTELESGGSACLQPCDAAGSSCPAGFECVRDDASGTELCQPSDGPCCVDEDGDGWGRGLGCTGRDCDDADTSIRPGASETCNGVDDDCDGETDEAPTECADGRCMAVVDGTFEAIDGASCEAGACSGGTAVSCGLFACEGGTEGAGGCASSCDATSGDDDALCVESAHCDGGECVADLAAGEPCDEDGDCESGSCESGACAAVTLEGSATGEAASSSGVDTVQTASSLPDLSDGLYVAAISTTPQDGVDVTSVSGLGLAWSQLAERCANDTQVEIWTAFGTPTMSEAVTAQTGVNATSIVIAAFAYSGVDPSVPIGDTATAASNGCDGSAYDPQLDYSVSLTTGTDGAVAFGAVAKQKAAHGPGTDFTERADLTASGVDFAAGVAVEDRTVSAARTLSVHGGFDTEIEWAAVAAEIRP